MTFLLRAFLPFALGYFISYALRVVNAVIAPELTAELGLDAEALGRLTAAYFFAFAAISIPLGGWLDRHRPEHVEACLLMVCALGCVLFAAVGMGAFAQDRTVMLTLARGLIGAGLASGLMAAFRAISYWQAPQNIAFFNGSMLAVGSVGALTATVPTKWLLGFVHWSQLFVGLAGLAVTAALWLGFFTPSRKPAHTSTANSTWAEVFAHPQYVLSLLFPSLTLAFALAFQSLWATPWLIDVAGVAKADIAAPLAFVTWGMLSGNIFSAFLGKYLSTKNVSMTKVAGVYTLLTTLLIVGIWQLGKYAPRPWFFALGFAAMGTNILFVGFSQYMPKEILGRANAGFNTLIFGLSFCCQYGMGVVLNGFTTAEKGRYQVAGYDQAFTLVLCLIACTAVLFVMALQKYEHAHSHR
ncbi:MAG: hypothetical protein RLZZ502_1685 [Pseudomonadota bacterium]